MAIRDAVLGRNLEAVIGYSNPSPIHGYAQFLRDTTSEEYKYLFDDQWSHSLIPPRPSICRFFSEVRNLDVLMERQVVQNAVVVTAYYYDPDVIKLAHPVNQDEVVHWGTKFITCRFTRTDRGWKVAYSIFDYGTDYLLDVEP